MVSKYSVADKDIFVHILSKYRIIENKRSDAYNIHKKKLAWEKITVEYNAAASEKRTLIQLKRLWDKIKRSRKRALAEERHELVATGDDPSKPSPSPQPEIVDIPHIKFEVDIDADSDGIHFCKSDAVTSVIQEGSPSPSSAPDINPLLVEYETTSPSSTPDVNTLPESPSTINVPIQRSKSFEKSHLTALTEARLKLIKKEETHMEELHKLQIEEAMYKKEAARLIMLQEEEKLKKLQNS